MILNLFFVLQFCFKFSQSNTLSFKYHRYEETLKFLTKTHEQNPSKTYLYNIGNTTEGRKLAVLAISNNEPLDEQKFYKLKNIKLIANIHGDEVVGKEILLHFITYLLTPSNDSGYLTMQNILGNDTILHILPSLNPDGFEHAYEAHNHVWRGNANPDIDLNRNFPDSIAVQSYSQNEKPISVQPETLAVKRWIQMIPFTFSVSFHGGAVVVSYPYDNLPLPVEEQSPASNDPANANPSDDVDVYQNLAWAYATRVDRSAIEPDCTRQGDYMNITNGAQWYPISGGMQDYNYFNGVFEVTIELSCPKFPSPDRLWVYWNSHRDALIAMLNETRKGLEGRIETQNGTPIWKAKVYVNQRKHFVISNQDGYFWRLLLPNEYYIRIEIPNITTMHYYIDIPKESGFRSAIFKV